MLKKAFLGLLFFFVLQGVSAQSLDVNERKNEFKANALMLVLGAFETSYERILSKESAIGISASVSFDDYNLDQNYAITPYYRYYFGKKAASGFFGEAFGSINSYDEWNYSNSPNFQSNFSEVVDFALGIGVGGKWVTSKGLILEINGGIGRNMFNSNNENYYREYNIIGRFGISVGYRF